jgi:hypothetical protein
MAQVIMSPLYIISGMVMAIGAYFTIRYRPYCALKSPEREIATELHRKKLLNEPMSEEEEYKNNVYKKNTQIYNYLSGLILLASVVHIVLFINSSMGETLMAKVTIGLIIFGQSTWLTGSTNRLPHCIKFFGLGGQSKNDQLNSLNALMNNTAKYNFLTHPTKYFQLQQFSLMFGIILNILLDVWFGLNGSLMVN